MSNEAQYIIDPERINALGGADFSNPPYARFTPAPSVSAEDFSFQNTFDSLKGQTESLSVSGVTGSIDTIEKTVSSRDRDDKKDDNGISWDDVTDLQREQREARERAIIENGRITMYGMTVAEEDMDEAVSQSLNNFDADAAKFGLEGKDKADYHYWMLIYQDAPDGSPQKAEALEQMGAINEGMTKHIVSEADRIGRARTSAPSLTEASDATIAKVEDDIVWQESREAQGLNADDIDLAAQVRSNDDVGNLAFLGDDPRQGPMVTPTFNFNASGAQQLAQAPAPAEPVRQSNVEFGMG
ncbi:hypothetical protein SAMN06295912_12814 [Sphingomonas laterariae]|uniref:Uncharacterized protein n=1 Tax=Edaphosphingomonas laterariae TaxID=861865 RepID=A0A239IXH0_9SPHN|nr:hypothetical protein [Sphingomonas laterariae]SNS98311.1 hypothetical protein SAMN06295912_12814 [Sphingomonas laterariae]